MGTERTLSIFISKVDGVPFEERREKKWEKRSVDAKIQIRIHKGTWPSNDNGRFIIRERT